MRILQIGSGDFFSTYGGGQVYVKNIVDEFIRQGDDIAIISTVNSIPQNQILEKKYKGKPLYEISRLSDDVYSEILKEIKPDIIHAHSNKAQICRIGSKLRIPVVITAHHGGILCPEGALLNCKDEICNVIPNHKDCLKCCLRNIRTGKYWRPFIKLLPENSYIKLGKFLSKKTFIPFITPIGCTALSMHSKQKDWQEISNLCTLMIAPSDAMGAAMTRCGLSKHKLRIIPHGIPLPENTPQFPEIRNGEIHFFYVGRICYVKGIHILLESFSRLKNAQAKLHLIGGSGNKTEARYEKRLKDKYKSDSRIIWHGKVSPDKIYKTIKDFHVSVAPSICMESFGLNISESLAMGKPVLATYCGGPEMQIKDNQNGWLIPSNNVKALASKMEEICKSIQDFEPDEICSTVHSMSKHVNLLKTLYKEL